MLVSLSKSHFFISMNVIKDIRFIFKEPCAFIQENTFILSLFCNGYYDDILISSVSDIMTISFISVIQMASV
jgi:hypothetical protein